MLGRNNYLNRIVCFIIIIFSMIAFSLIYGKLNEYNLSCIWIAFTLNLIVIGVSFAVNGIDFVTLFMLCLVLLLFPIMIQYFTGESYGVLGLNLISLNMPSILLSVYIYNTVFLLCSIITNFKIDEKFILNDISYIDLKKFNIIFNNIVAIIFTFVAFPRLSLATNASERFDMLLPGHAWNQLAIVALIFNLSSFKESTSVKLTYLFVISWFLINGERADITGLIIGILLIYFLSGKRSSEHKHNKYVFQLIFIIIFFILLNYIGHLRNGQNITLVKSFTSLFITPTLADVGYLYNVVFDYINRFGLLNGKLLLANIESAVPFININDFSEIITASKYINPGGEPLLAEPIMDFGILGLPIISILDFVIFRLLIHCRNSFFKYEFLIILCSIPRMVWYGRSYAFSSILFFGPIMYLANSIISKRIK